MPGTGHATIDDFPPLQADRLMLAYIGNGGKFFVVFEDGDPFAIEGNNFCAIVLNVMHGTHFYKFLIRLDRFMVLCSFAFSRQEMKRNNGATSNARNDIARAKSHTEKTPIKHEE